MVAYRRSSVSMPVMDTDSGSDESALSTLQRMSTPSLSSSCAGCTQGSVDTCWNALDVLPHGDLCFNPAALTASDDICKWHSSAMSTPDLLCVLP